MTKLEEKLTDLGYEYYAFDECYRKKFTNHIYLIIDVIDDEINELCSGIKLIKDLDIWDKNLLNLVIEAEQQAFNQLQNDLEVLKKYEN